MAALIIPISSSTYDTEDQELLKALASYVLFFFMLARESHHRGVA